MTLLEALAASRPAAGDMTSPHKPIRRAVWVKGTRIQWIPEHSCWVYASLLEREIGPHRSRSLRVVESLLRPDQRAAQGMLTPDTMLAVDWELA